MAKNMARIKDGIVINVEWCSDNALETDILKDMDDRTVVIGDTYSDGNFYHDGKRILTSLETLVEYEHALVEIEAALGV